jgi:hypothetical protein
MPDGQHQFLLKLSKSFQTLCRAATDGKYEDKFFDDPSSDDEYPEPLRAVLRNLNPAISERSPQVRGVRDYIRDWMKP